MELRGESVVLRPLAREDVPRVAELARDPEIACWWPHLTEAELTEKAEGRADSTPLAILEDEQLVGMIQYHEEDDPEYRSAGMDLFVSAAARGRGLGPDAVRTLARWLVRERGHHRLTIDPAADNLAAVRAYQKAGFRPVGVMREYWTDADGVRHDGLLMDLLASEL